jgi:hypothetical protein
MAYIRLNLLITILFASTLSSLVSASSNYEFDVIAQTGDNPSGGGGALSSVLNTVSVNDKGMVAFAGTTPKGDSVFIGDTNTSPINISFPTPNSSRTYRSGIQINNLNQVLAIDRITGAFLI